MQNSNQHPQVVAIANTLDRYTLLDQPTILNIQDMAEDRYMVKLEADSEVAYYIVSPINNSADLLRWI